jgi:hypothetical protein
MMGQTMTAVAGSALRHIVMVLVVAALMSMLVVAMAAPAFAAPGSPQIANGHPSPNNNAFNQGTDKAFQKTPQNQPCATQCS